MLRLRSAPFPWPLARAGVLVIAPHPDDESLGCGRLIAECIRRQIPLSIVWLTDGEAGLENFAGGPAALAETRRHEARAAAAALGVAETQFHFLALPDGQLPRLSPEACAGAVQQLSAIIADLSPGLVLVTSAHDGSTEHAAAEKLAVSATMSSPHSPPLFAYLVWAHWQVRPLARILRCGTPVWFAAASREAQSIRLLALQQHRTQLAPVPPRLNAVLTGDFLACFNRHGEFFLPVRS